MSILRTLTIKKLTEEAPIKSSWRAMRFQVTHMGRKAPSLRRFTLPKFPSDHGLQLKALHFVRREEREISAIQTMQPTQMMGQKTICASEQGFLASKLSLYMTENRRTLEFLCYATIYSQN